MEVELGEGKVKLKEGMVLCTPTEGPCEVVAIEKKKILGKDVNFCKLVSKIDGLNVFLPLEKMRGMGVRTVISAENAKKILTNIFDKHAKTMKGVWTKKVQEYEKKLYSGNIVLVAEIVRDLFANMKDPSRSYGERAIYNNALNKMVEEFALALGVSKQEAHKTITDKLEEKYVATHKNIVSKMEDDFMDGDSDENNDFEDDDSDFDDSENVA